VAQGGVLKEARIIRLLLPLLRQRAWGLPATILLGIASALAESVGLSLFLPLLQSLEHRSVEAGDPDSLQHFFRFVLRHVPADSPMPYIVGLILAMTVAKNILTYSHSVLSARVNSGITHWLRCRIFSKMIGISQETLDASGSGRLINILATGTWHASDAMSLLIGMAINLSAVLVFSVLLLALSWKLTTLVVVGVIAVSMLLQVVAHRARGLGQQGVEANAVMSGHMLDALDGNREIQMFGLQNHCRMLCDAVSEKVRSIYFRLDLLHRAVSPLSETLYVSLLLGLFLIGVTGRDSVPAVVVFLLVLYRLQPQIRQIDSARLSLLALTGPVEEVVGLLHTPEPIRPAHRATSIGDAPDIEFSHVTFAYPAHAADREFAVKDASFRIPFGSVTAIIGPSGSGKTTLVSLLCRFYGPASGLIRVGGQDLSAIHPDEWRSRIAWVSQDAYIFSASVAENIRYGRLDASRDEILEAARRADVDSFVGQLTEGYETRIGNGGCQLSSGQIQRIALARAFVRKPSILILDEATNALDSISESLIRSRYPSPEAQSTVIIISHRLSTVRHADQVIVVSNGRISEQGLPSELASQRGFFSQFRELQHVD
jgi:subfamily B ATP-binding cassette protein MsbA